MQTPPGSRAALLLSVLMLGGGQPARRRAGDGVPLGALLGAALSLFVLLTIVSLRAQSIPLLLTGYALMVLFQSV